MKFESKFGLGEIVCTHQTIRGDRIYQDALLKVIGLTFTLEGAPTYMARLSEGHIVTLMESELIGDPDFDQEAWGYPEGADHESQPLR
jgi:hypothetical protein